MSKMLIVEFDDEEAVFEKVIQLLRYDYDFSVRSLPMYMEFQKYYLQSKGVLSFPCFEMYPKRRKVYSGCREITLTKKEFDILSMLVVNKGRVITYEQIYQNVWNEPPVGRVSNIISYHILNLRKKLDMVQVFSIQCVRELGYCLQLKETEGKSG